jgi:tetratricopeptide (TPR) repeat protein
MMRRFVFLAFFLPAFFVPDLSAQTGIGRDTGRTALQSYRLGRDLEAQNRLQEADVYYSEAVRVTNEEISRNTATRDSYTVLTWALQRQKKYADVIIWGERGLRLYGDEYRIVETMGEAYFYLDDYDNSLRFMQRYVNLAPQGERVSVAYFFIGEIYRLRRQFRHADIAYTTAVRLEPNVALWWYRLGSAREAAGDNAPASEAYQRALRLNPNYQEAAAGLARTANSSNR